MTRRRVGRHLWRMIALLLLVLAVLSLIPPQTVLAEATPITTITQIPFNFVVTGCTEDIAFNGSIQWVFHVTVDATGGFHLEELFHPQGLTGVGQTTGITYHAVGETRDGFNGKVGLEQTYVNNFKLIGNGDAANNYLVHETFHFVVNANGTVTVFHDRFSIECR